MRLFQITERSIPNILKYLSVFFCILSIFPIIWISQYVYPSLDDYCYTWKSIDLGYFQSQEFLYRELNGRFTATALLTTNPLVYRNLIFFQLIPFVLILLTFLGIYTFLKKLLDIRPHTCTLFTLYFGTLYFAFMPEITEGLYWMAGAITYQLSIIFLLFIYTLILKRYHKKSLPSIFILCITSLLSFFLSGLNETAMAFHFGLLVCILIYKGYYTQKIDFFILIVWVFTALGALLVIFSPGSAKRAAAFPTNQSILAFAETFLYSGFLFWKWLLTTPVLVLSILYIISPQHISLSTKLKLPSVGLSWLLFLGGIYLTTFVGFWSLGFRPPPRTVNVIFFIFLMGWCITFLITLEKIKYLKINAGKAYPYVLSVLFILIGSFYTTPYNNSVRSYKEWLMGIIYDYRQDMTYRITLLQTDTNDTLNLPPLRHEDIIIRYRDLAEDPSFWANGCYADYHGRKAVRIVDSAAFFHSIRN